jgi:Protein of unknown function (DUF1552)
MKISRRMVLRSATGAGLALPYLEAMGPSHRAHAAPAGALTKDGFPKRIIFMFTPNGTELPRWRPSGSGTNFTIAQNSILKPLDAKRDSCLFIDGLDMQSRNLQKIGGNAHDMGMAHLLTGRAMVAGPQGVGQFSHLWDGSAGGISLDQEIANQLKGSTRFHSLQLGVRVSFNGQRLTNHMSWAAVNQPKACVSNPRDVFNSLFDAQQGPGGNDAAVKLARRKRLADAVLDDYKKLNARLGASDKQLLEGHVTGLTSLRERLDQEPVQPTCTRPTFKDSGDFRESAIAQMDNVVAAFSCDLARVATFQWATSQGGTRFPWLGVDTDHHGLSHDNSAEAHDKMANIYQWYAGQLALLVDKLKAVKEGNGTLADNTVVVWLSEQSDGFNHIGNDIPVVLAGSLGGHFRMGRYVTFPGTVSLNDLHVSLLQAFGIQSNTFGDQAVCKGALSGLTA